MSETQTKTSTHSPRRITVFLSSPSDVRAELEAVQRAVDEIQGDAFWGQRCTIDLLKYEEKVPPEMGRPAQQIVDDYMRKAGESDICVCILCHRMGTEPVVDRETGREYLSGTHYEFCHAYQATKATGRPRLLLYRGLTPPPPKPTREQREQFDRVCRLFDEFASAGDSPGDSCDGQAGPLRQAIAGRARGGRAVEP